MCAYAFPRCTIRDGRPKMLPLCYEDCEATHQQFCYTDWILLEEKRDRGLPLKTRGHFRLPDCKTLPRYNRSTAAEHPICSYVGLTEMNPDDITCKLKNFMMTIFVRRCIIEKKSEIKTTPKKRKATENKLNDFLTFVYSFYFLYIVAFTIHTNTHTRTFAFR